MKIKTSDGWVKLQGLKGDPGLTLFANDAARAAAIPAFVGQLGLQQDTERAYIADGLAAGDWDEASAATFGAEASGAVSTHADLTTGVHGVADGTIAKVADISTDANLSSAAQAAITASHAKGTDQGLDAGGANAVTAAQAKDGYSHSQAAHAPAGAEANAAAASQNEMEAGTESGLRSMSPLTVRQGVAAYAPAKTALQALGNKSGAVTLTLVPGNTHGVAIDNDVTSWAFEGLAHGDVAMAQISNGTAKAVAATGLVGFVEASLTRSGLDATTLTAALWDLFIYNDGGTYYHWGVKRA